MKAALRSAHTKVRRCPACGQRIESLFVTSCSLCGYAFGNEHATGADVTPYAKAYAREETGWRLMLEWVWYAGSGRLKHLALMRASAASRRFARTNVILLAFFIAVVQTSVVGWRQAGGGDPSEQVSPAGRGWLRVAEAPLSTSSDQAAAAPPVSLWWSPVQAIFAFVATFVTAMLLMWLLLTVLRAGVTLAHTRRYRLEQRMTAALHYSTAWAIPLMLGAVVASLRPVTFVGAVAGWTWQVPQRVFLLAAAVFAAFGAVMWWFWMVRVGFTAPTKTRSRVALFWAVPGPLAVIVLAAGWWLGLAQCFPPLFARLEVQF